MPNKESKHRRSQSKLALAEPCERRLLLSTYTVNTMSNAVNPVTGQHTRRQAVVVANTNPGSDTIAFDPTVFTTSSLHTIVLTQGEIQFTETIGATTVNGPGQSVLAVSGNHTSRVFQISSCTIFAISGLTITNGAMNISGNK